MVKMLAKFNERVDRLTEKMERSATPVPGFIVGLSGTDSTVAFLMVIEAARRLGKAHRVYGIHYAHPQRRGPTWFEQSVLPWLREQAPEARIEVLHPAGGNSDQHRWADLHVRALHEVDEQGHITPLFDQNYWVVGTINATERALGTYSRLADTASVQPLHTLNKTAILGICAELGVPDVAIEIARQPDCLCGRDELAAQNIELIDQILDHQIDVTAHDPFKLDTLLAYVRTMRAENGYKQRIPYTI